MMRIVIATALNSGEAEYKNMGDVAMLQAAVVRLLSLSPDARIEVLTDSPSNLAQFCPGASPLPREGCVCWIEDGILLGGYHQSLPKWLSAWLSAVKRSIGIRWPTIVEKLTLLKLRFHDPHGYRGNLSHLIEAQKKCDVMVICGAGGFADSCREWNLFALAVMGSAIGRGKTVVMFGQGIGPLSDPFVLSWARHVLPRVTLIALRGTKGGQELLQAIGVHPARIVTTGDDAIEPANSAKLPAKRNAIGINLRVAFYSDVNAESVAKVSSVLQEFARLRHADLLPVPIAFHEYARDHETIRQLLTGFDEQSDGGSTLDTPLKIMEQTARCKVVVTGAYHAAVFALAQGIPVVCLSNSSYYSAKFEGLEELFGVGCATIMLDDPDFGEKLRAAVEQAWNSADEVRPALLNSAARQIECGRAAYASIQDHRGLQPRLAGAIH
jgi:polysaccharide pyruvyl transferase WcaK-like protein